MGEITGIRNKAKAAFYLILTSAQQSTLNRRRWPVKRVS
jgi:hypothetical protein